MTFAEFVRLSRAYVWVLIGCTVLGAVAMIAKTTQDPVLYSATSSGLVYVGNAATTGEEQSNSELAEDKANLYAFLVSKTPVAEEVIMACTAPVANICGTSGTWITVGLAPSSSARRAVSGL